MPPQRTFPSVKPLKTERTHEENQERAYIAASRRSDRSLEARVESARRASEIHKRRTGRSLRVTEQDVINEEMYEEEDDDIPSQYRRLSAHLQTGSAEFNRRLQSYLANHVAMRSVLNNAIHSDFSQHYPNAPQFAHNSSMFPSPLVTSGFHQQMEPVRSPSVVSPHTPHAYRSAPYPITGRQGFRGQQQQQQQQQQGSPSMRMLPPAKVQTLASNPSTPGAEAPMVSRRMSMPTVKTGRPDLQVATSEVPSPLSDGASPVGLNNEVDYFTQVPIVSSSIVESPSLAKDTAAQVQPALPTHLPNFPSQSSISPFSMALPLESQQMINTAALPPNDFTAALMQGSENWLLDSDPLGASNPEEMLKADSNFYPNTTGMNSTLLPDYVTAGVPVATEGVDPNYLLSAQNIDFGQYLDFGGSNSSNAPSGAGTPLADPQSWQDMVDSGWVEEPNTA